MICGPFIIIQYLEYCKFCKLDVISHNLLFGKHWYVEKHKIWTFCKNCDSSTRVAKYWDIEILGWCPVASLTSWGGASLALVGCPSCDGVTIKMPYWVFYINQLCTLALLMNILHTGNMPMQRGFFTNSAGYLLPALGFLGGLYNFLNFVIIFSLM